MSRVLAAFCFVLFAASVEAASVEAQTTPQALTLAGVSDCIKDAIGASAVEISGDGLIFSCTARVVAAGAKHRVASRRRMMQICTHDRMCGMPAAARMLDRVLQHIRGKEGVWFARKDEIAHWAISHPEHTPVVQRGRVAETGLPGPA